MKIVKDALSISELKEMAKRCTEILLKRLLM